MSFYVSSENTSLTYDEKKKLIVVSFGNARGSSVVNFIDYDRDDDMDEMHSEFVRNGLKVVPVDIRPQYFT
jgi:hypothetical protein